MGERVIPEWLKRCMPQDPVTEPDLSSRSQAAVAAREQRSPWYVAVLDGALERARRGPGWWRR